jgi:hypothetical protein
MRVLAVSLAAAFVFALETAARAQPSADDATESARAAFQRGVALAQGEQWGEALAAFEEAAAGRDHPRVQYNIGYCERALGRYADARRSFRRALKDPHDLEPLEIEEAEAYLKIADNVVARVAVTLQPSTAALAVDGLPLVADEADELGNGSTYAVAVGHRGPPGALNRSSFVLVLDPGPHVFHASRPGHEDVTVDRSYAPGQRAALDLRLDLLPASVSIRSEPTGAIVSVDRREVGLAPIDFQRPAGTYKVKVALDRFVTYSATLDLQPGQRVALTAKLPPEREALTQTWWFWTGAAAVVVTGAALTYFLTRRAPEAPPYQGGNTGWIAHTQGLRW